MKLSFLYLLLLLIGATFAITYGGEAFPNASVHTTSWFINTTTPYPYPMVYNQSNATVIIVNSSYPFNISFTIQLNNQEGEIQNLNLTSPQLVCNDYNNNETYGNYSNTTLNNWQCNQSEPAGVYYFQINATDLVQSNSTPQILTGTYQADVAQPASAPLAYAPDHAMGSPNASTYGTTYSQNGAYDTPYTTLLAMQQLKEREQNATVANMTITPVETFPVKNITIANTTNQTAPVVNSTPLVKSTPLAIIHAAVPQENLSIPIDNTTNGIGVPAPPELPQTEVIGLSIGIGVVAMVCAWFYLQMTKKPPVRPYTFTPPQIE